MPLSSRRGARGADLPRCVRADLYRRATFPLDGRVADAMARSEGAGYRISPLVKCECLVGPIRRGDPVLERAYTELFALFIAGYAGAGVSASSAVACPLLCADAPDALHLACAQYHRYAALWTNDNRLVQASHGLARNVLDDAD
jgi:hypothetical protein